MTTTDAQAAEFLNEVEARARHQGVVSHTVKVQSDQVHIAIVDAAIENGCDLIAMGSHGRGSVASFLIGSVTARVLSHSRIPVLVYR
jgi:nucleotide-binding universal stress UspA family protein